ncbi:hypothetical protein [Ruegeria profundi]|uniref:hypothetical protein n=1 Tax=Ruegeria profundi TaxID=1685378 RepID=UPI001CD70B99|nr:hypothetical protein [Ruegeria profundi]MCA0928813.1 hypothetical protein [Ruegeria profundi]
MGMLKCTLIYLATLTALIGLVSCAGVQDTTANASLQSASSGGGVHSSVSPRAVDVQPFTMVRGVGVLPGRIGERTTVGDITMGYVTLNPPPEALFTEAIKSELSAAGHNVTGGQTKVSGVVERFALSTPATATYWDVTIDAALKVTVGGTTRAYSDVCVSRTYVWPSDKMIADLSSKCVSGIARRFAGDRSIANAL